MRSVWLPYPWKQSVASPIYAVGVRVNKEYDTGQQYDKEQMSITYSKSRKN